MSEMRIYPDWEPQIVTLSGNLPDGTITSVDYYCEPKSHSLYPIHGPGTKDYLKREWASHIKCECGEVYKKEYYTKCKKCRDKAEKDKYLALPVVPMSYPCFVNDRYINDEDELECYIEDEEITDTTTLEIYPAEKIEFKFDLLDQIDDWCCNEGIEDFSLSQSDEKLLNNLSLDVELMVNTNLNWYEAVTSYRMIYEAD